MSLDAKIKQDLRDELADSDKKIAALESQVASLTARLRGLEAQAARYREALNYATAGSIAIMRKCDQALAEFEKTKNPKEEE